MVCSAQMERPSLRLHLFINFPHHSKKVPKMIPAGFRVQGKHRNLSRFLYGSVQCSPLISEATSCSNTTNGHAGHQITPVFREIPQAAFISVLLARGTFRDSSPLLKSGKNP